MVESYPEDTHITASHHETIIEVPLDIGELINAYTTEERKRKVSEQKMRVIQAIKEATKGRAE